jgi:hypothetical protein
MLASICRSFLENRFRIAGKDHRSLPGPDCRSGLQCTLAHPSACLALAPSPFPALSFFTDVTHFPLLATIFPPAFWGFKYRPVPDGGWSIRRPLRLASDTCSIVQWQAFGSCGPQHVFHVAPRSAPCGILSADNVDGCSRLKNASGYRRLRR